MNKAISILAHRGLYVFDKKANQNPFLMQLIEIMELKLIFEIWTED